MRSPSGPVRASQALGRIEPWVSDLHCEARSSGWRAVLRHLAGYAGRALYRAEDELVLRTSLVPAAAEPDTALRVERGSDRHLPLLTAFDRRRCRAHATPSQIPARDGREVVLGFAGDELIGCVWWADHRSGQEHFDVKHLGLTLQEDEVFAFDMYVAPEHRGQGRASRFLEQACGELARLGYRRAWGSVRATNRPARWLYRISGWEEVGRSRSRHVLSLLLLTEGRVVLTVGSSWKRLV